MDNMCPRGYKCRMQLDWSFFFVALGLAFLLEGLPYFLLADRMPDILLSLAGKTPRVLRALGHDSGRAAGGHGPVVLIQQKSFHL